MSDKVNLQRRRYAMPPKKSDPLRVDVLIVGSGPIGATFARRIVEGAPDKTVLMVDIGAQLTRAPGENAKNIYLYNYGEDGLDTLSQIVKGELTYTSHPTQDPWPETLGPISQPRMPPVKYQINGGNPDQADWDNMPAAASSFNVGGMGAHWTCCTPRPTPEEKIPFIPDAEWDALVGRAETLLKTTQGAFVESFRGQVIRERLGGVFDHALPQGRKVQMLPLACERQSETWVEWTGVDTILGPLGRPGGVPGGRFQLRPETICRELYRDGDRITGARIEDLKTLTDQDVVADLVIVAANPLYTPQLLWQSGIRPKALGRYMNDQPMTFCQIVLKHDILDEIRAKWDAPPPSVDPVPIPIDDPIPNVWIPFSYPEHPYHCQIHRDAFPYSILAGNAGIDHRSIIDLRWFSRKEVRFEDHITFSETNKDLYGMPQITFHYTMSRKDEQTVAGAMADMAKAAETLGAYLPGAEPQVLPRGSSLHIQGTFRMGQDGEAGDSVCDPYSRVWGFRNLVLGGNGIIPTATACNPTLTSVALALRASDRILADWAESEAAGTAARQLEPAQ